MSKIWYYGDSFSTGRDPANYTVYTNMLADALGAELHITAKGGSSLGWLMYESMKHRHEYAEDDYIIFQTTTLDRGFLDKTKPGLAEFWKDCPDWNSLTREQQKGYTFYLTEMHDHDILKTQFQAWIHGIAHYTKHLKVKPLVTTAWNIGEIEMPEGWKRSKGVLLDLSMGEFSGSYDDSINWMLDNAGDPRHNHFSTCNHYKIKDMYYKALTEAEFVPDFNELDQNIYNEYPALGDYSWGGSWIK